MSDLHGLPVATWDELLSSVRALDTLAYPAGFVVLTRERWERMQPDSRTVTRRLGTCPLCGRRVVVRDDGTLGGHNGGAQHRRSRSLGCRGTGWWPVETRENALAALRGLAALDGRAR